MSLLIIDDATTFRKVLSMALHSLGISSPLEASSAAEARQVLLEHPSEVKLIICDWHMPGETGLEFLRWLREQPAYKSLPFLMLTTEQERGHVLEAARLGIQGYIFKPVQKTILGQKLLELGILPH